LSALLDRRLDESAKGWELELFGFGDLDAPHTELAGHLAAA
jgi:hypothetical protein